MRMLRLHVGEDVRSKQSEMEVSGAFVDRLLRELGEDTASIGSVREVTVGDICEG